MQKIYCCQVFGSDSLFAICLCARGVRESISSYGALLAFQCKANEIHTYITHHPALKHESSMIKDIQACEGVALGSLFVRAEFTLRKYILLGVIFLLITPIGVAIGIGVGASYQSESKVALGFEGGFDSLSAGILIYNAIADLILPTFAPAEMPTNKWIKAMGFVGLFLGAGIMSLIGKWA